jgi:hypothetical protein
LVAAGALEPLWSSSIAWHSRRPRLRISALHLDSDAVDVQTTDLALHIVLADGRNLDAPLEWFPRLRDAAR